MSSSIETLWAVPAPPSPSPRQRAWRRFKHHRLGYWSGWLLLVLCVLSLCAELLSNDKPLLVRYQGQCVVPLLHYPPETTFGGDFDTPDRLPRPLISSGD